MGCVEEKRRLAIGPGPEPYINHYSYSRGPTDDKCLSSPRLIKIGMLISTNGSPSCLVWKQRNSVLNPDPNLNPVPLTGIAVAAEWPVIRHNGKNLVATRFIGPQRHPLHLQS